MSIRMKLVLAAIIVSVVTLFATITFMNNQSLAIITESEQREMNLLAEVINTKLSDEIEATEAITLSVALNREVQRLFAERDREGLTAMLLPAYEAVKDRYAQMQFHLPDSTSFLRLHQLDNYGDSLKDFRFTVNEANRTQTVAAGLEEGRGGYGLRVVAPMFYNGLHTGSVEFGGNFGAAFLQELQSELGGQFFIYQFADTSLAWTGEGVQDSGLLVGTAAADGWPVDPGLHSDLQQGITHSYIADGNSANVVLLPLRDFQDSVIGYLKIVQDRTHIVDRTNTSRLYGYLLGLVAALIVALVLFLLLSYLLKPLQVLVKSAGTMAAGDFTADLSYRDKDEIGQVYRALGEVQAQLRKVIGDVVANAASLASTSEETSAATQETAASIEEVASSINQFAATVERLNSKAQGVAREAGHVATQASESSDDIGKAISTSEGLERRIQDLAVTVRELGENSKQIGGILDVINQVAAQTELLALNAAIEAARAGEHGRGFAVVADEVRKLAEQVAKATGEIATLIKTIQDGTQKTVRGMEEGTKEAVISAQITRENGAGIQVIIESVKGITEAIQDMSEDIGQIEAGSESIAAVTEEQSASTEQIASAAQDLSTIATKLNGVVEWFKL